MKTVYFLFTVLILSGCVTPVGDTLRIVDLTIIQTNTPAVTTVASGIRSQVKSSGSDLCYNFNHFGVLQSGNVFEIRAKGTYPEGKPICPLAIYYKDTSVTLSTPSPGQYILKFFNGTGLFKSDTVQVN